MGSGASTIRQNRELDSALKQNITEKELELAYADYSVLSIQCGTSDELSSSLLLKYKHIINENVDLNTLNGHLKDFLEKAQIAEYDSINLTGSETDFNNIDIEPSVVEDVAVTADNPNIPVSYDTKDKRPSVSNKSKQTDNNSAISNKSEYQKVKQVSASMDETNSRRLRSASEDDFSRMGLPKKQTSSSSSTSQITEESAKPPLVPKSNDDARTVTINHSNSNGSDDKSLVRADSGSHIMTLHSSNMGIDRRVSYESSVQRVHRLATMPTIYEPLTGSTNAAVNDSSSNEGLVLEDELSCVLCHVFFQTPAQKQRHIKHSETHAKQMVELKKQRKLVGLAMAEESMNKAQLAKKRELELAMAKKAERSKWKVIRETTFKSSSQSKDSSISGGLLYSGTKYFWRDRDDMKVLMFLHTKQRTLEVVAVDIDSGMECNRIYLSLTNVMRMIDEKKLRLSFDDGFLSHRYETAKRQAICTFVLSRLQRESGTNRKKLVFVPSATDDFSTIDNKPMLLTTIPEGLVPGSITGEVKPVLSRTPSKDFGESLMKLETERRQLGQVVEVAAKYAMQAVPFDS